VASATAPQAIHPYLRDRFLGVEKASEYIVKADLVNLEIGRELDLGYKCSGRAKDRPSNLRRPHAREILNPEVVLAVDNQARVGW
jgi:hypothetical protein